MTKIVSDFPGVSGLNASPSTSVKAVLPPGLFDLNNSITRSLSFTLFYV